MIKNNFGNFGAYISRQLFKNDQKILAEKYFHAIHDELVTNCSAAEIGSAIANCSTENQESIEFCFKKADATKFYQLVVHIMYTEFEDLAIKIASEAVEYE